jgi:transcription elongation factor SPT6
LFVQVREGFIVEDEDDEEEDADDSDAREKPIKRKREHRDREEDAQLDEEDLELIGEQIPDWERKPTTQVRRCSLESAGTITS